MTASTPAHENVNSEAARTAAEEVDRLRAVIENAPHDARCTVRWGKRFGYFCTCWKADALG